MAIVRVLQNAKDTRFKSEVMILRYSDAHVLAHTNAKVILVEKIAHAQLNATVVIKFKHLKRKNLTRLLDLALVSLHARKVIPVEPVRAPKDAKDTLCKLEAVILMYLDSLVHAHMNVQAIPVQNSAHVELNA